ncbi:MAG: SCO family protein [Planctomycetota bacterium]
MTRQKTIWMVGSSVVLLGVLAVVMALGPGGPPSGPGREVFVAGAETNPPLPVYYDAPAFALTDQLGRAVTDDDLRGKVWVADFFFTSCPGICPVLSRNMQRLNRAIADHPRRDELRLVSFSLDPETDTPEVLAEYAEALGAAPDRWLFLTGEKQVLWNLSEDGFKLIVDDNFQDPLNPIAHSGKVVLIDRLGVVRGYYDGLTAEGIQAAQRDLLRLLEE